MILLAEDDTSTRAFLRLYLEKMGHAVVEASDGTMALATMRTAKVHLVVTDLEMPGTSGLDLIDAIRGGPQRNVPIIAISGHPDMLSQATAAGVQYALQKPIRYAQLEPLVRALTPP